MNLVERLKKDKKGFTLVEMIVVIVIIGILLAILVPGMFKYIQKAKDKQILVNALPLIIMYPFAQKFFEKGVMVGSVKG